MNKFSEDYNSRSQYGGDNRSHTPHGHDQRSRTPQFFNQGGAQNPNPAPQDYHHPQPPPQEGQMPFRAGRPSNPMNQQGNPRPKRVSGSRSDGGVHESEHHLSSKKKPWSQGVANTPTVGEEAEYLAETHNPAGSQEMVHSRSSEAVNGFGQYAHPYNRGSQEFAYPPSAHNEGANFDAGSSYGSRGSQEVARRERRAGGQASNQRYSNGSLDAYHSENEAGSLNTNPRYSGGSMEAFHPQTFGSGAGHKDFNSGQKGIPP